MNNRAQFFFLYLVVLTFALCAIFIFNHVALRDELELSVVSPEEIFVVRDEVELFEIAEREIIVETFEKTSATYEFGSEEFLQNFRINFLDDIGDDLDVLEFFSSGVVIGERELKEGEVEWDSFFENVLYPEESFSYENFKVTDGKVSYSGNGLRFSRTEVSRKGILSSSGRDAIKFDMEYSYEFGGDYYVLMRGSEVIVSFK
jgi:hypothetical protein